MMFLKNYTQKNLWYFCALGFSSGVPFLLILGVFSFWLAESGVTKTTIGLLTWISIPYGFKFLWAPIVDHYNVVWLERWLPKLGRYQQWYIVSQGLMIAALCLFGNLDPINNLWIMALCGAAACFFATIQDLVVDAYRIRLLNQDQVGAGAALEAIGFRFGMLASGAGALCIAHLWGWPMAYGICSMGCLVGTLSVLNLPPINYGEPMGKDLDITPQPKTSFSTRLIATFSHYFTGIFCLLRGMSIYHLVFLIIGLKFADTVIQSMMAPFLTDLRVEKIEFAHLTKSFGIPMMVIGSVLVGGFFDAIGIRRLILSTLALSSLSATLWLAQAILGYHQSFLILTIGISGLLSGIVGTTFISYLSLLTKGTLLTKEFLLNKEIVPLDQSSSTTPDATDKKVSILDYNTAFIFSLLYSIGSIVRVIVSTLAGVVADHWGWKVMFVVASIVSLVGFIAIAVGPKSHLHEKY